MRQAYNGNVMAGNHCIAILKQFPELTSVVGDYVDICKKYDDIFQLFSEIIHYVMSRRFLEDGEIQKVGILCHKIGKCSLCSSQNEILSTKFMSWYSAFHDLSQNSRP